MAATCRRFVFVAPIAAVVLLGLLPASTIHSARARSHQVVTSNGIARDSVRAALTLDVCDPDDSDDLNQERLLAILEVGVGLLAIPTGSHRLAPAPQPRTDSVPGCTSLSPRAPPLAASLNA